MESVYHIVAIRVNGTSWAHVWRLHFRYLGTGYDRGPQEITINNARYFDTSMFKDFCHQVGTKVSFTFVYHPQSNGAIERAHALFFEAIRKIIEGEKKGKWA
jgi:hypothetical protein